LQKTRRSRIVRIDLPDYRDLYDLRVPAPIQAVVDYTWRNDDILRFQTVQLLKNNTDFFEIKNLQIAAGFII
jgi:hypothetical protein